MSRKAKTRPTGVLIIDEAGRAPRPRRMRMAKQDSNLGSAWWAKNLDDVDNEIARLAIACNVRILDPGVIERVLNNDASVCGSRNPAGFEKLRTALKMHYHIRGQTAGSMGEAQTAQIVAEIVERLKARIGDRLGGPPAK